MRGRSVASLAVVICASFVCASFVCRAASAANAAVDVATRPPGAAVGVATRPPGAEPDPAVPTPEARPENGYWSTGRPRWFVSAKGDLGLIYAKPALSAGYGLPHWIWTGVDVNAVTTTDFGYAYAGVRGATPLLDIAFGARDTYSYRRPFLAPRPGPFVASDLRGAGKNARYWAMELEVVGAVPLPHSAVVLSYIAVRTLDVPASKLVYDEPNRAIVARPFYQVFRVAPVVRLLREDALKAGALIELLTSTGRSQNVFRIGPAFAFQLTDHLEALGTLTLAVSSPDNLGLVLGAYGLGGLRYRWATGERDPQLPWRGSRIP